MSTSKASANFSKIPRKNKVDAFTSIDHTLESKVRAKALGLMKVSTPKGVEIQFVREFDPGSG